MDAAWINNLLNDRRQREQRALAQAQQTEEQSLPVETVETERDELRKLDAEIAEKVMGWKPSSILLHGRTQGGFIDSDGQAHSINCGCVEDFNPSEDISAAMLVEDRIAELGLQQKYGIALAKAPPAWVATSNVLAQLYWQLAHATPEQRCRAALAVLVGKE